jgi:NAD(P)H-dependent FMN reductase
VIQILALSGSLRKASSNTALLRAAAALAPVGVRIDLFEHLGALPPFSPDLEADLYEDQQTAPRARTGALNPTFTAVRVLQDAVREADGLLIACPEYARGVPGAFKNALDWLVGCDAFVAKPFVQFNASPRASHAQAALRTTLETMSGRIIEEACIAVPLINRGLDATAILADEALAAPIREAVCAFAAGIEQFRRTA